MPRFELQQLVDDDGWDTVAVFDERDHAQKALHLELQGTQDLDPTDPSVTMLDVKSIREVFEELDDETQIAPQRSIEVERLRSFAQED